MRQTTVFAAHNEWLGTWGTDYGNNGDCDFPVIGIEAIQAIDERYVSDDVSGSIKSDVYEAISEAVYKAAGEQE